MDAWCAESDPHLPPDRRTLSVGLCLDTVTAAPSPAPHPVQTAGWLEGSAEHSPARGERGQEGHFLRAPPGGPDPLAASGAGPAGPLAGSTPSLPALDLCQIRRRPEVFTDTATHDATAAYSEGSVAEVLQDATLARVPFSGCRRTSTLMRSRTWRATMLLILLLAHYGLAQESGAPFPEETRLANGLRIWRFPGGDAGSFLVMALVGAGSRHESPDCGGLAHLVEHCLFRSTTQRSTRERLNGATPARARARVRQSGRAPWRRASRPGENPRLRLD
ncbi:MAG: insulinase family protein [Planctomycetota bacterium]